LGLGPDADGQGPWLRFSSEPGRGPPSEIVEVGEAGAGPRHLVRRVAAVTDIPAAPSDRAAERAGFGGPAGRVPSRCSVFNSEDGSRVEGGGRAVSDGADDAVRPAPWVLDLRGSDPPVLVQVRRWAARALGTVAEAHLADVLLVATELVTNAYDHGHGPRQLRMSHTAAPCRVRIEIDDSNPTHPAVVRPPTDALGGRGMLLVEKLTERWGVEDLAQTGGKTVWAEISCDGSSRQACGADEEHDGASRR
jgi:anti-sigma regulatory factor (Ser/Thr protein kinase)